MSLENDLAGVSDNIAKEIGPSKTAYLTFGGWNEFALRTVYFSTRAPVPKDGSDVLAGFCFLCQGAWTCSPRGTQLRGEK